MTKRVRVFFIHGVNKRREVEHVFAGAPDSGSARDGFGKKYQLELAGLEANLRHCLTDLAAELEFIPIYWGEHGVRFNWYEQVDPNASKPRYRSLVQRRGSHKKVSIKAAQTSQGTAPLADEDCARLLDRLERLAASLPTPEPTLKDLLFAQPAGVLTIMLEAELDLQQADADARIEAAAAVATLSARIGTEATLRTKIEATADLGADADLELIGLLARELSARNGATAQGLWPMSVIKRAFSRFLLVPKTKHEDTYANTGRFFGDSVRYFMGRGTRETPGLIIKSVLEQINDKRPQVGDDITLVLTHSLGGALFCDIAAHFDTKLHFDLWLSVGSQIAYYEDAKLLKVSELKECFSHDGVEGIDGREVEMPLPAGAKWYNIYNSIDPLAFPALPVFSNVIDVRLESEWLSWESHNAYFQDPGFYAAFMTVVAPSVNSALTDFGPTLRGLSLERSPA